MSDNELLLHVLKEIRDTNKEKKYGICGEVIHSLKKYYMVGHGFSDKGPNHSKRCEAVTRVQTVLYKLMVQWPGGRQHAKIRRSTQSGLAMGKPTPPRTPKLAYKGAGE